MPKEKKYMIAMGLVTAVSVIALITVLLVRPGSEAGATEVVAEVNGDPITKEELYTAMYEEFAGGQTFGERTLEQLIQRKLVEQEAKKQNISFSDAEVEAKIDEELEKWKQDFGSEEQFELLLNQSGMTLEQLKESLKKELPFSMMLEKLFEDQIEITDEEIADYYEQYQHLFQEPEQVRASHILVDDEKKAQDLLAQLREGADFATLASEHSQDESTAKNGGDLGYFERGQMVEAFESAAFSMEVGEISDVVESEYGYHIILVTDKVTEVQRSLDEVRDQIYDDLFAQKLNEQVPAWLDEQMNKADIKRY
jgi:foldase protein PrsA